MAELLKEKLQGQQVVLAYLRFSIELFYIGYW